MTSSLSFIAVLMLVLPSPQDVSDHARPAGPGTIPGPHRGLGNLLIPGGQVEQVPAVDVIDE